MKKEIISYLQSQVEKHQAKYREAQGYIFENFNENLADWGERMWKAKFLMGCYEQEIEDVKHSHRLAIDQIKYDIDILSEFYLYPTMVRKDSANELANTISTWKFECILQFINDLKSL